MMTLRSLEPILDGQSANTAILDRSGVILSVNRAWRDFADQNQLRWPDYGLNVNYLEICDSASGHDSAEARTAAHGIRQILSGELQQFQLEYPCHSPEKKRWFNMKAFRFELNGVVHVVVGHEDVTHLKETKDSLREREQQMYMLQEQLAHIARLSTMGEMASGIAHELKQPLAAISNYAYGCVRLLQSPKPDSSQIIYGLEQIAQQAERASQVIQHLRSFIARKETDRSTLCVNDLVREALTLYRMELAGTAVEIQLELYDSLPLVSADRIQIEQVLINLMRNGIEAMADTPLKVLSIRTALSAPKSVQVAVCDAGRGLSKEIEARLFTPFVTTNPGGLGMGLAISRRIIEAHQGKIWAERNPDRGTTVCFTIPAARIG